jgi:hypothetical protein
MLKIINFINDIRVIINELIDKPSIIFLVVKIYEKWFKANIFIKNEIEEEKEEEYLIKILNYCDHCFKIINAEMYCYKDKYYCSEKCRSNYYE